MLQSITKFNVSVIIPVYNVENYVKKCIDSVLVQRGVIFEIILVDDGSTDGSPQICDEYAQKYDNITVIHKENKGLGLARNSGLDIAKGEYIFFIDSDDWIAEDTLNNVFKLAKCNNADIVVFDYVMVNERKKVPITQPKENTEILSRQQAIKRYLMGLPATAWTKLYRAEIFNEERFADVVIHEDAYSMHLFLNRADIVVITNQIYYIQYIRKGSLTQTKFQRKNFICVECGERVVKFVSENYPELIDFAYYNLLERQVYTIDLIASSFQYKKYKKDIEKIVKDVTNEIIYVENNKEIMVTEVYKNAMSIKNDCFGYVVKKEIQSILYKSKIKLACIVHSLGANK
jgi:glycosyltransferase involved in cell wall biosynthesis